jgi:hypothetical protein
MSRSISKFKHDNLKTTESPFNFNLPWETLIVLVLENTEDHIIDL